MSEIHGMSQRGGSVTTQIRFGDSVYSPTINIGEAIFFNFPLIIIIIINNIIINLALI